MRKVLIAGFGLSAVVMAGLAYAKAVPSPIGGYEEDVDANVEALFNRYDADGDGSITRDEVIRYYESQSE